MQTLRYQHAQVNVYVRVNPCIYTYILTNIPIYTLTDKNLLQLKQNLYIKINYNEVNLVPVIYNLHNRHEQFSGFQDLIFNLKMFRFSESLKLVSAIFYQIFIFHQMIAIQKL